jgi:hypothetical protein
MHAWHGAVLSILLVAGTAAADDPKPHSSQANRMTECNARAADQKLAGDARKQFMAECLKGSGDARVAKAAKTSPRSSDGEPTGQAHKMKICSQDAAAKGLHGDERKQFMSQCLRSDKKQ